MAEIFGLDFGTTNTLVATVASGRALVYADDQNRSHPSVVIYRGDETIVGRLAKEQLGQSGAGVIGNAVVSPKAKLGSGHTFPRGRTIAPAPRGCLGDPGSRTGRGDPAPQQPRDQVGVR